MSYTLKLLIPVLLGIAAAATNWISISARTKPVQFTKAVRPIKEGQVISVGDLAPVAIPVNQAASLGKTAIPYKQMSTLSGQVALRPIEKDDMLFWSDAPIRGPRLDRRAGDRYAVSVPLGRVRTPPLTVGDTVALLLPQANDSSSQRKWYGPFRILAVDGRKTMDGRSANNRRVEELTIALPRKTREQDRRLLDYLENRAEEDLRLSVRLEWGSGNAN